MLKLLLKYILFRLAALCRSSRTDETKDHGASSGSALKLRQASPYERHYPSTFIPDRSMWGLNRHLKDFDSLRTYFEHGIYFGDIIVPQQRLSFVNRIITQSRYGAEVLKSEIEKPIVVVDNYMYWVDIESDGGNDSDEFFLYFPAHSTASIKTSFSVGESLEEIRKYVGDARIRVAVFHLDYTKERVADIVARGAEPICFGNRYSPYFMRNLKLAMTRCSGIFTSDIGSHVAYALAVGKVPIIIDGEDSELTRDESRWKKEIALYTDFNSVVEQKKMVTVALMHHMKKGEFAQSQLNFLSEIFGLR